MIESITGKEGAMILNAIEMGNHGEISLLVMSKKEEVIRVNWNGRNKYVLSKKIWEKIRIDYDLVKWVYKNSPWIPPVDGVIIPLKDKNNRIYLVDKRELKQKLEYFFEEVTEEFMIEYQLTLEEYSHKFWERNIKAVRTN